MAGSSFLNARIPSDTLHKPTGQARVRVNGKDRYLGPYGSVESRRLYGELMAKLASGVDIENELVEPATRQKLEAVSPLLAGHMEAPDHPARKPVSQEQIEADRVKLCQRHRDLIDLRLFTGARSGELLS